MPAKFPIRVYCLDSRSIYERYSILVNNDTRIVEVLSYLLSDADILKLSNGPVGYYYGDKGLWKVALPLQLHHHVYPRLNIYLTLDGSFPHLDHVRLDRNPKFVHIEPPLNDTVRGMNGIILNPLLDILKSQIQDLENSMSQLQVEHEKSANRNTSNVDCNTRCLTEVSKNYSIDDHLTNRVRNNTNHTKSTTIGPPRRALCYVELRFDCKCQSLHVEMLNVFGKRLMTIRKLVIQDYSTRHEVDMGYHGLGTQKKKIHLYPWFADRFEVYIVNDNGDKISESIFVEDGYSTTDFIIKNKNNGSSYIGNSGYLLAVSDDINGSDSNSDLVLVTQNETLSGDEDWEHISI